MILQSANCEDLKRLSEETPDWWLELSDDDQYYNLYIAQNKAVDYFEDKERKQELLDISKIALVQNNEILTDAKKIITKIWYPKFGFGLSALGGLHYDKFNYNIAPDVFASLDLYFYFLRGRVALTPSIVVKFENNIGAGIKLGFIINI